MSVFQRLVIATIAAILGAQLPGLITSPPPALSEGNCVYRWGDLNRAAEQAGASVYRDLHGYGTNYRQASSQADSAATATVGEAAYGAYSADGYAASAESWGAN
ncbi:MAG: hypothetical protein KME45_11570 [Stenomitos rutilans HA7619-LM2]|jgi:hypothetical protein|nr:hypothetical protein [Stenomitos rutilans HA7619-LM2]